jgi:hypothetical protein
MKALFDAWLRPEPAELTARTAAALTTQKGLCVAEAASCSIRTYPVVCPLLAHALCHCFLLSFLCWQGDLAPASA